jgi:hypothetical protein
MLTELSWPPCHEWAPRNHNVCAVLNWEQQQWHSLQQKLFIFSWYGDSHLPIKLRYASPPNPCVISLIILCSANPRSMIGDGSEKVDMCVYISLSISQNAIVLSPTKALNQRVHGYTHRTLETPNKWVTRTDLMLFTLPGSATQATYH